MKQLFIRIFVLSLLMGLTPVYAEEVAIKPFQRGDWSALQKANKGAPLAIHFWGVTCPSCVKEMPLWGRFMRQNPTAKVIFIQADDVSVESMQNMLKKASLLNADNYYVSGPFDERLRYEVDPSWHGETPATFLIDRNGRISKKIGAIDFLQLKAFLLRGS